MSTFDRTLFCERLKQRREEVGFSSQKDFATAIGVSVQSINFYEAGKRLPDAETLYMLSEQLNCSIDWLLGRTENKMPDYTYIERITGLSEDAISNLESFYDGSFYARRNLVLNILIESGYLISIIDNLVDVCDRLHACEERHNRHKAMLSVNEKDAWRVSFLEHQKDSIIEEMLDYHAYTFSKDMDALRNEILACLSTQYGEAMIIQKSVELEMIRVYQSMILKDYGLI